MQYADEFFDKEDNIRWCPIVYWKNHNFQLNDTDINYIMAMIEDIDVDRYKKANISVQKSERCKGIIFWKWQSDIFIEEDFNYGINNTDEGVIVSYDGDVNTFVFCDNVIYYAYEDEYGSMKVLIDENANSDYFELYNIKTATKSPKIYYR